MTQQNSLARAIVDAVREPLILLTKNLRIITASRSFYQTYVIDPQQAHDCLFYEIWGGEQNSVALKALLEASVLGHKIEGFELEYEFAGIGRRVNRLNTRPVSDETNPNAALLLTIEDITVRHDIETLQGDLLRQKDTFLQEIQHRVANSLQIIASILLLKMRAVTSEETRGHLRDAHQRVMAVATVQQQLRESVLGDRIEIGPYLTRLCEGLSKSMIDDDRKLTVRSSATGSTALSNDAVSFGLIVTELVINSLKHGFPDAREGSIAVDFTGNDRDWTLTVSDDGLGRRPKSDEVKRVGLGTSIVEALAKQLKARIETTDMQPGLRVSLIHTG